VTEIPEDRQNDNDGSGGGGSGSPSEASPTVGIVRDDLTPKQGESDPSKDGGEKQPQPGGPKSPPTPAVPSIVDVESSFNDAREPEDGQSSSSSDGASAPGRLGLPGSTVQGGGADYETPPAEEKGKEGGDEDKAPSQTPKIEEALARQSDLLAEFAKIADELQRILGNLENSTFVKRLKAASRRQLEIAGDMNLTLTTFGVDEEQVAESQRERVLKVSEREIAQSENIYNILGDLEAYYDRKQTSALKLVADDMIATEVVDNLKGLGKAITDNLNGQSIFEAEFWADNLDRWAEELIGPGSPPSPPSSSESESDPQPPGPPPQSLPPEIVLEVMKLLEEEIQLREETRGLEQAREALAADAFGQRSMALSTTQKGLRKRALAAVKTLSELPDGEASFSEEIKLLTKVAEVMGEARKILARPDTGPEAIAAETEVIELLMETQRVQPPPGGSNSSGMSMDSSDIPSSGGGVGPGFGPDGSPADKAALSLIGSGADPNAHVENRPVGQATGTTGRTLPEEFRTGLDAYFDLLEGDHGGGSR